MQNQRILIFSDCYIFGGSEKLMTFLLKNEILLEKYSLIFSYRKHKDYEIGLNNEGLLDRKKNHPLILMSNDTIFYKINCLNISKFLKVLLKLPLFIFYKIKIYHLWNLISFIFLLIKTRPDIIHINNGGYPGAKTCNILVLANFLTYKSKIIYQINNQALDCKGIFEVYYDKFINKNANRFINASLRAKQQLVEKRNFDSEKIIQVNNCVPLPRIRINRNQILNDLKIPTDSFLIVQVAFLSERKGQKYLIEALNYLFKNKLITNEKVYCLFIGDGEDEKYLKNQISNLGLNNIIFMLGYKNNSEDYIAACDLFILPSIKDEDMPLVLLSALGFGKPIIASDFAGISQVIKNNVNGVLIESNISNLKNNLATEILRLYIDKNLRIKLSENAKATYKNYNPTSYGEKLKNIYEQTYAE